MKHILVILGMHRSGTSMVARMCNLLGADLGPDLMPPGPDNPSGFWEHRGIADIDDKLLGLAGTAWNDPLPLMDGWLHLPETQKLRQKLQELLHKDFSTSKLPAVKDPRICRLLPIWQEVFQAIHWDPKFLFVYRNPLDVERSLAVRNGLRPATSLLLWLRYVLEAERHSRGWPRAFVSYDGLLDDWRSGLSAAFRRLHIAWPADSAAVSAEVDEFANSHLRHHHAAPQELAARPHLARFLERVHTAFIRVVEEPGFAQEAFAPLQDELDDIFYLLDPVFSDLRVQGSGLAQARAEEAARLEAAFRESLQRQEETFREWIGIQESELARLRGIAEDRHAEIQQLAEAFKRNESDLVAAQAIIADRDREIADHCRKIDEMVHSNSWRLTAPLRKFSELLRRPLPADLMRSLRQAPRAWYVLRRQGLEALVRAVRRKLERTPYQGNFTSGLISLPTRFEPLAFPRVDDPVVSVIVCAYNKFEYTYACLGSLAKHESTASFEIIVVNDASTDETERCLNQCANLRLVTNEQNLGFIRSCNRGAAAARGHFLAFLNNDTQILPGWLNALVETFDIKRDAGLVGSKLIYPNGSLQEAGGIVWRDGSAWNYGRHDDPGRPEYNYLRAADYCSGASILLRRQIFEELGGFDEHYLPAYYEDTDLAFRLRQKGLQVYYQPLSCVVHFEGITSGVETAQSSNIKRFQLVNHQKFIERWRPCLSHHRANGDEPELEKERNVARRLLVVDEYMVVPDKESGSLRMFNMLQILSALGYKVTFAPLNLESRQPYLGQLQKRGIECLYTPFVRSVDAHLQEKGRLYDVVILSRANVAHEILKSVRSNCPGARVVFDTVDLHFLREEREASLFEDRQLKVMARKRRQQELAIIRESDLTFVVSAVEKRLIEREAPGKDVHIVSNIHEIHGRQAGFRERRGILFVGSFNHPPNADGVSYFVSEIFPLVKKAIPDIVFYVIGDTPPRKVASLANEHVKIMGYVADLIPFFEKCRLSVAPLRFGAGVKGKVSMSLSLGVPVIGTSVALEGMFLEHGRSAMMADDAELFAKCIVDVYSDEELWNCLSNNGLKVLQENFSFDAAKRALRDALCVSS